MTIKSTIYDLIVSRRYDAELETVTEDARRRCVAAITNGQACVEANSNKHGRRGSWRG